MENASTIPLSFLFIFLFSSAIPLAGAQPNNNTNNSYYTSLSPSVAIIIVTLIVLLFIMAFFSVYFIICADSPSNSIGNFTARSRHAACRLDASVIETFPIFEYSVVKFHKIGKSTLECAVCLNEFEDTETLRLIPKCDHVFHTECIDEWLGSRTTCPVCRAELVPQPGDSVQGNPNPLLNTKPHDIEAQNDVVECLHQSTEASVKGSQSGRARWFPRSSSTGHSLVQPGENTERFTLRMPMEVRKQILENPKLHRARSLILLPRETSSRRGYRNGGGGGGEGFESERWVFTMAPPFLVRASSSIRSPVKVRTSDPTATATTIDSPSLV